jgi:hypothetical protein
MTATNGSPFPRVVEEDRNDVSGKALVCHMSGYATNQELRL